MTSRARRIRSGPPSRARKESPVFRNRPNRTRKESPPNRLHRDHVDKRRHDLSPVTAVVRGRERSPEDLPRRHTRWETASHQHSRSRSRNRDRFDRRELHSRSPSVEIIRFEPPEQRMFAESRRRSSSRERDRPEGHWREEDVVTNKFSPPPFPSNEFREALAKASYNPVFEVWNSQVQPNGPVEANPPLVEHRGFHPSQHFSVPVVNQPFLEGQEFLHGSMGSQGLPEGPSFTSSANALDTSGQDTDNPLIPEFNPETSKLSSYEWIKLIEETAKQRDWKKDEKNYIMTSRLAGFARHWYLATGINYKIWRELKGAFFKAFPSEMEFYTLLQKMVARTKEDDESMSSYFHHKVALLNACEIHGRKAVSCIIGGLQNSKFKYQAKAQNCDDPDSLYLYLRSCTEELSKKPNEPNEPKGKSKGAGRSGRQSCFFCKSTTHMVANCPIKHSRCTICFELGHSSHKHDKDEKNPTNNSVMHGSLSRKPTFSKYFTEVGINGMALKGYVDQASECTTIREENALSLKLPIRKQYRVIRGFGGSSISSIGVVEIALCIDRAIANVKVLVVPDHIQAIPVIVGQSFTEQTHVVVMKDGDRIRFYQRMDNGETNFDF